MSANKAEVEPVVVKKGDDTCEVFIYDPEKVERRQQELAQTKDLSQLFKVFADDTRLKILYALTQEDELCVCDVATIIGASNATASHHLRMLRNLGIAQYQKKGKMVFYSLVSDHVHHLMQEALQLKGKGMNII
ncbi:ArsR/SmtB family transcription factor [Terrihalobacillus insolitus]|uniref:ArsR/SmtB family transcription factor n=1 Tax=Terrihalobacillus insolitus TaxID=2950438 RepID=UPI00233FBDFF|nr:metalloregulator ArsR/SmtB family transcription factor [Terrihalobacillus insolitus]